MRRRAGDLEAGAPAPPAAAPAAAAPAAAAAQSAERQRDASSLPVGLPRPDGGKVINAVGRNRGIIGAPLDRKLDFFWHRLDQVRRALTLGCPDVSVWVK